MKHLYLSILTILFTSISFTSCEKPLNGIGDDDDQTEHPKDDEVRVVFNMTSIEHLPFSQSSSAASPRKTSNVSEVCTHISLSLFENGKLADKCTQTSDESNFGRIALNLEKGTYEIVIIAHNGQGPSTIKTPDEIKFKDNKVTDTFYYYATITIDGNKSFDITLKRSVAMFRLVVNDNTPKTVKQMKFYYTGGSSTFNAVTGYGCVDSRQTEYREVETSAYSSSSTYEIYTFPHNTGKKLSIRVSALDSNGSIICEKEFDNVSINKCEITQYSGNFFGESAGDGRVIELTVDNTWEQTDHKY